MSSGRSRLSVSATQRSNAILKTARRGTLDDLDQGHYFREPTAAPGAYCGW
jgi:hypothetical protein